jgi:uncharacterized repeat protein (TIGR04052 family)
MRIISVALASSLIIGCSDSKTEASRPITIEFAARNKQEAISCEKALAGLGLSVVTARLKDFRFYISDPALIGANGERFPISLDLGPWQSERIALVDFLDRQDGCDGDPKETHTRITGTLPSEASGRRLEFTVGVPEDWNHIDSVGAPAPLDVASLYWSWQGGFKFMRIDLAPEGGITRPDEPDFLATTFNFHLGSTDCVGQPESGESVQCERANRPLIVLDGYTENVSRVVLRYDKLIADLDLAVDQADTPGCMAATSDPECQSIFEHLGLDFVSGKVASNGDQTVFSLEQSP